MATIKAKRIVEALRGAYDIAPPFDFNAGKRDIQAARELQALALGHLIPGLSDEQIQVSGALTFHDVPCLTCHGRGYLVVGHCSRMRREAGTCPTCGGDGFSPPISA